MKIVFCDVDGTFCHYGDPIPQINIDAIKALQAQGDRFVFVSGRNLEQINSILEEHNVDCDMIFANGSGFCLMGEKPRYTSILDANLLSHIMPILDEEDVFYHCHTDKGVTLRPMHHYKAHFERLIPFFNALGEQGATAIKFKENYFTHDCHHHESPLSYFQQHPEIKVLKFEIMEPDAEKTQKIISRLAPYNVYHYSSFPSNLEIVHPNATKGHGIRDYLALFPASKTYALGDEKNDIEMFEAVDFKVAVANAKEQIKEMADHITDDVMSGGVGKFIFEHLINK